MKEMYIQKEIYIQSDRFIIRNLELSDVNENYCSWFKDKITKQYIEAAKHMDSLKTLKTYVQERLNRSDVIFLGIFTPFNEHIGNIKYEPVDFEKSFAVVGVLIGLPEWRSKGVVKEAILASAGFLKLKLGINKIVLGVAKDNLHAIKAYKKIGFIAQATPQFIKASDHGMEMILFL